MPLTMLEPIVAPAPKIAATKSISIHLRNFRNGLRVKEHTGIAHLLAKFFPILFELAGSFPLRWDRGARLAYFER